MIYQCVLKFNNYSNVIVSVASHQYMIGKQNINND
jgi:hypothetical protein